VEECWNIPLPGSEAGLTPDRLDQRQVHSVAGSVTGKHNQWQGYGPGTLKNTSLHFPSLTLPSSPLTFPLSSPLTCPHSLHVAGQASF